MDCEVAHSGQRTLDAVARRLPDALLLDVNIVDYDGFEILKKLRRNLAMRRIRVLMITARSQASDITQGFGSGANDYVIKPFDPPDLVRRLEKAITAARECSA